jgi:hypothetical protein
VRPRIVADDIARADDVVDKRHIIQHGFEGGQIGMDL